MVIGCFRIAWILQTFSLQGGDAVPDDGPQMYGADRDDAEASSASLGRRLTE